MLRTIAIVAAVGAIVGATSLPFPADAGQGGWHGHFGDRGRYGRGYGYFGGARGFHHDMGGGHFGALHDGGFGGGNFSSMGMHSGFGAYRGFPGYFGYGGYGLGLGGHGLGEYRGN